MLFHAVAEWPFPANVVRNCLLFGNISKAALSSGTRNRKLDSITAKPL
ncbi:hypothetical protein V6Z11_A08G287900 [Gossypium hirsutum]